MSGLLGHVRGSIQVKADVRGHWGVTTSTAGRDALRRGNVVVNSVGTTCGHSPVKLTVGFGQAQVLGGSVNGGSDTFLRTHVDSVGQGHVGGFVGLDVLGGRVAGSNIISTQLAAKDGTVTGRL
jgi:hypothetical protein